MPTATTRTSLRSALRSAARPGLRAGAASLAAVAAVLLLLAPPALAAPVRIRIATLAPDGSAWMKLSHAWARSVVKGTQGRVKIKFYAGGVQGDEKDVLRKIKLGQLGGAAITGIGLATIDTEVRALDMAQNKQQLDEMRAKLGERLRKKFEEKGYVLLGWGDVGPVHLFSAQPITTVKQLRDAKLWLWSDDPISRKIFAALKLNGVPMGVPDVLPALQTGTVNAFFGSPLSTLALQWSTKVHYMTSLVMSQATGATVVSKPLWDQIAPADQQLILAKSKEMQDILLKQVRNDNEKALKVLASQGVKEMPTPKPLEEYLRDGAQKVVEEIGKTMDPDFRAMVQKIVEGFASKGAK